MDKKFYEFSSVSCVYIFVCLVRLCILNTYLNFEFFKKENVRFITFNMTLCNLIGCYRITAKHITLRSANHEAGSSTFFQNS